MDIVPTESQRGNNAPRLAFIQAMTLGDATMLAVGTMIGSGIFIVSAGIARAVGSPAALLAVWTLTGALTVLGALAYGELSAMYPHAGGQYVYLREAFGPLSGFLYGWTLLLVIQTGSIAAVAVAFARFLSVLVPAIGQDPLAYLPHFSVCAPALGCHSPADAFLVGLTPQRLVSLAVVWALTGVNTLGIKAGKRVQTSFTIVKASTLVVLILLALTIGRNAAAVAANFTRPGFFVQTPIARPVVLTFLAGLIGALFSTDAWNNVTFAAAEVQNPRRNLPLALLLGTGLVTALYLLTNVAYLSALPLAGVPTGATTIARGIQYAAQDRVATAVAEQMFGGAGASLMAAAVLVSTFGCNNGLILAGARVYYAMARDGLFFAPAGRLNRHQVPAAALVVQALWVSVLCVTGTYSQLIGYVIFAALAFYALTTVGIFVLRRTRPDVPRPYRAWGYPLLPATYIVCTTLVALSLLLVDATRAQSLGGLALVLMGIPVYWLWRAVNPAPPSTS
jgi:APA family basic amino acid/polyamine antiporter